MMKSGKVSNIKKIAVIGIVIIALIGVSSIVLSGIIASPFDRALNEIREIPGVILEEESGTGNGNTGKAVLEEFARGMEEWCAVENINLLNRNEPVSYIWDSFGNKYSEQSLMAFKSLLFSAVDGGILYQGKVCYNRNLKYILFETEELISSSGVTFINIRYHYLYFE